MHGHARVPFFYQCSYSFTGVGLLPHLLPLQGWAESSAGAVSDNKATLTVAEKTGRKKSSIGSS